MKEEFVIKNLNLFIEINLIFNLNLFYLYIYQFIYFFGKIKLFFSSSQILYVSYFSNC